MPKIWNAFVAEFFDRYPWSGKVPDDLHTESFEKTHKVHDWRNYIPGPIRVIWHDLRDGTRVLLWILAEESASNEEWD